VAPEQASPHWPQLLGSLASERHCPLQLVVPLGHAHAPFVQASPPAQASPHFPQFSGSVPVMMHACPHAVWPGPEQTQLEPEQTWPAPQLVPHDPQLPESVVMSAQRSPQRTVPALQVPAHALAAQTRPAPQAWLHAPQLAGSFATFVQVPLQGTSVPVQVAASVLASTASVLASPASGTPPEQLPPSQRTVGVQLMSCPQTPTELRPQLGAAKATNSKTIVARRLAGSEAGRWKRIVKSPNKEARAGVGKRRSRQARSTPAARAPKL
jgi:hypothetical protein